MAQNVNGAVQFLNCYVAGNSALGNGTLLLSLRDCFI